jgi:hypothetical protein
MSASRPKSKLLVLATGIALSALGISPVLAGGDDLLFSPTFDKANAYRSYTYPNLYADIERSRNKSDAYIGQRIKVYAKASSVAHGNINPALRNIVKKEQENAALSIFLGPRVNVTCNVCSRTWRISDADNVAFLGGGVFVDMARANFNIYLAFPSDKSFVEFRDVLFSKCNIDNREKDKPNANAQAACYLAAAGTLDHEIADIHESLWPFGPSKGKHDFPYLKVEKLELYVDSEGAAQQDQANKELFIKTVTLAGKVLWQIYSYIPK